MATVRICICGDESTGKSSLLASLVKDSFLPPSTRITSVLPPITIPPSESPLHPLTNNAPTLSATSLSSSSALASFQATNHTPTPTTIIVDTSALPHLRPTLRTELRKSNVILLVYSDHYSYERVALFWMPYFRSLGVNVPVVLCANKSDLASSPSSGTPGTNGANITTQQVVEEELLPVMAEFKEIDSCIRTSARDHHNVNEVFYLCQKAVTHPIAPLFDSKDGSLKPSCITALRRIFYLCDKDQDGLLNDGEVQAFQQKCFGRDLSTDDLQEIKTSLSRHQTPDAPSLDTSRGLNVEAFLLLNKLYAEKGRHETIWCILRTFHYTDSLSLASSFLQPPFTIPNYSSAELSPSGYRFFVDLFLLFDKDNDGGLSPDELDLLFAPTPGLPPSWTEGGFPSSTVRNEAGYITLQGWLAQWSMTTFVEPHTTLEYLALLGFEDGGTTTSALKITKPRKRRRRPGRVERNVVLCYVLGASGAGKSALLDAFLNRPFSGLHHPTIRPRTAVNSVEVGGGRQCYLILEEHGTLSPAYLENASKTELADLICYTYDSSDPDSFDELVELRRKHPHLDNLPSLYVALKADRDRSTQRTPLQPHDYTAALAFPPPLHVSVTWDSISELFVQLAEAATYPSTAFPAPKDGEGGGVVWGTLAGVDRTVWLGAAVGVCASAVTGWVVYRRYSRG